MSIELAVIIAVAVIAGIIVLRFVVALGVIIFIARHIADDDRNPDERRWRR